MKNLVRLLFVISIGLCLVSCGSAEGNNVQQAKAEVQKKLAKTLVQCGDSWFIKKKELGPTPPDFTYTEYKQMKISTEPQKLTEASKLNGLEWSVRVAYDLTGPKREYLTGAEKYGRQLKWSDWGQHTTKAAYYVFKKNGQIVVERDNMEWQTPLLEGEGLSCAEIPDGRPTTGASAGKTSGPKQEGPFRISEKSYSEKDDLASAAAASCGPEYGLADWDDVVQHSMTNKALADKLGWEPGENNSLFVVWRGKRFWQDGNRQFFITRFDHNKPSDYLSHDNIDNHSIDLGSYFGRSYRILCIKKGQ